MPTSPTVMDRSAMRETGESVMRETPRLTGMEGSNPQTPRSSNRAQEMSISDMESKLLPRPLKGGRHGSLPMSARELLEDNKQLILEKKEQKALARKNSRELVQKLIEEDRVKSEGIKATDQSKRSMQRELAQQYKAAIEKKEAQRAAVKAAASQGQHISYFPFVEGETIAKGRAAKSAVLREEMQGFLQQQRQKQPPRNDALIKDTRADNVLLYSIRPNATVPVSRKEKMDVEVEETDMKLVDESGAHMARHPLFLTKSRDHMSRRLYDEHVRRALEDKVEQTKVELATLAKKRQDEINMLEDSMLVADALRHDGTTAKADARRRHALFLKDQIEEQRQRRRAEKESKRIEAAGYWGPEEKPTQTVETHRSHCQDLIKQMEVDQNRRLIDRSMRLRQEQQIVNNCMVQMEQDRELERQKVAQHRDVLVTTWQSQVQLRE
ncbi:unnamed protein product, partial [Symbiodinium sp. CCMP2592]